MPKNHDSERFMNRCSLKLKVPSHRRSIEFDELFQDLVFYSFSLSTSIDSKVETPERDRGTNFFFLPLI